MRFPVLPVGIRKLWLVAGDRLARQWASPSGEAEGARVQAGQEKISLNLLPGECVRTPRITLLAWTAARDELSTYAALVPGARPAGPNGQRCVPGCCLRRKRGGIHRARSRTAREH